MDIGAMSIRIATFRTSDSHYEASASVYAFSSLVLMADGMDCDLDLFGEAWIFSYVRNFMSGATLLHQWSDLGGQVAPDT